LTTPNDAADQNRMTRVRAHDWRRLAVRAWRAMAMRWTPAPMISRP